MDEVEGGGEHDTAGYSVGYSLPLRTQAAQKPERDGAQAVCVRMSVRFTVQTRVWWAPRSEARWIVLRAYTGDLSAYPVTNATSVVNRNTLHTDTWPVDSTAWCTGVRAVGQGTSMKERQLCCGSVERASTSCAVSMARRPAGLPNNAAFSDTRATQGWINSVPKARPCRPLCGLTHRSGAGCFVLGHCDSCLDEGGSL